MESIWVNSAVTSGGTAESIELSRLIKETVRISWSRTKDVMEVGEEKHIYRNHSIGRNKNKLYLSANRAPRWNPSGRLEPTLLRPASPIEDVMR